ncbi:MAG: asparagine synthase (glutamine-hydrolyzing) [Ignavibacterium sp.]|nr:asparagine synthase (glutamine-hydrolyzing) [Ignavibacterium sp.]
MSGLLAIISKKPDEKINYQQLKVMTDTLYHRGPDDEGYVMFHNGKAFDLNNLKGDYNSILKAYYDSNLSRDTGKKGSIAFGYRRLSILDLSPLGHQPMNNQNRYWIIFNGEIYNYIEIRKELRAKGYAFKSETDTEVIPAAYDNWGADCFNRFNGMWALIIYDIKENRIIISRDRLGIKPLYFFEDESKIIFASEIKAIHKANLSSKIVDIEKTRSFLFNGDNAYSSDTILTNVKRFPAASYCVISSIDPFIDTEKFKTFWKLEVNCDRYSFNKEVLDKNIVVYRELLENSIRLHSQADVKVGATLSGGLDSSSIVYFLIKAAEGKNYPVETFSNVYTDPGLIKLDETEYINLLNNYLKFNNYKTTPNNDSIYDDLSDIIYYSDLPTNSTNISGWYTYKLIKENGITVTLDGVGADTLFSGVYSDYTIFLKNLKINLFLNELKLSKKNYSDLNINKMLLYKAFMYLPENLRLKVADHLGLYKYINLSLNQYLGKILIEEVKTDLRYIDSLSMAHSVESRFPFLDHKLIEFAFMLNESYKISRGWPKYISRKAMSGFLPDEIVWRKEKMGWPNADNLWFEDIHKNKVTKIISNSNLISNIVNKKEKELIITGNFYGKKIRALSLSLWERRFL